MLKEILTLAREYGLSTYDASYLDLAMRKGLPIATLDTAVIRAAQKSKVEILPVM
jgi:predicted nucleic acid-binding protein